MSHYAYSTLDEIRFIQNLGSFNSFHKKKSRKDLLKKYLNQCKNRKDWLNIDKDEVIEYAKKELAKA